MVRQALQWWKLSSALALCCVAPLICADNQQFYRYVNEHGVKVINHTLPPEYAQNGYEILSVSGQVIEVVAPAPSEGEVAREYAEQALREKYEVLKRRYSSLDEIERAKMRRLENINTNISILRGNIGSINIRIENLMSQAAEMERIGKQVSARVLQQLADAKAELTVAENALSIRLGEYQAVSDRFDNEVATFIEGSKLVDIDKQLN